MRCAFARLGVLGLACGVTLLGPGLVGCGQGEEAFGGGVGAAGQGGDHGLGGAGATAAGGATGGDGAAAAGGAAAGGSGGGAAMGGTTGVGGSGGAAGGCSTGSQPTEPAQLDLLLMVDQSGSMAEGSKWVAMVAAIQSFVSAAQSDGIGVGLLYFPAPPADPSSIPTACTTDPDCGLYGPCMQYFNQCTGSFSTDSSCDPADYQSPEQPISMLPGAEAALIGSLSSHDCTGSSTPTEPAMQGAASYATGWAQAHASHVTAIVLATDGEPTNCTSNTIAGAANAAAVALGADPSVSTFVIGIGELYVDLDPIAQAGGTGQILAVAAGSEQQFLDALAEIRDSRRCSYPIPPPPGGPTNPDQVNVLLIDPSLPDSPTTIANVASAAACQPTVDGWYFDPGHPNRFVLCSATCADANDSGLDVSVEHGCPTVH